MSRGLTNGLRILGVLAAVVLLGWWAWPRTTAPQTEEALARMAFEALRTGDYKRLEPGVPTQQDLRQIGLKAQTPGNADRTLLWLAEQGRRTTPRPFPSVQEALETTRKIFAPSVRQAPLTFAGLDGGRMGRAVPAFRDLSFWVVSEGERHRFQLGACILTERGWLTVEGLRYDGPRAGGLADVVPGSVVYQFAHDAALPEANRDEIYGALRRRLALSPYRGGHVLAAEPGRLDVVMPAGFPEDDALLRAFVTGGTDLTLRLEILPAQDGGRAPAGPPPPKTSWPPDAGAFLAFKEVEVARWREAQAEGRSYVPSHAGRRLVKRRGRAGSQVSDFHLIARPPAQERFGGRVVSRADVVTDALHGPTIQVWLQPEPAVRYFHWTQKNTGLPLAIVVGEELHAVSLLEGGSFNVAIRWSYGKDTPLAEVEAILQRIQLGLGLSRLRAPGLGQPLRFVGVERK